MYKHQNIIDQMTLEEKAAFLSGKNEWQTRDYQHLGIPSICYSDGPHGVRKQAGTGDHLGLNVSLPATCFPTAATVANSWSEQLGEEIGTALGEEAKFLGVDVLLGPGLNIKRSPLCGRNFEYFSEDPYLSGKMAAAYIRGIQSQGISACPKHFAVNSQETRRMAMNSVVDERTMREIYLTGFEIAVTEGKPKAIMTSYNQVNGTYTNENEHLLKKILRGDWKYDQTVVTDWGGSNDHVKGVAAGSDLEMPAPGLESARLIVRAIQEGILGMDSLDESVDRMLDLIFTIKGSAHEKKDGNDASAIPEKIQKEHHALAKKAAAESIVLLKNENRILPLKAGKKVAIVGTFANDPRYQGAGSSKVNSIAVDTITKEIQNYDLDLIGFSAGYHTDGKEDAALADGSLALAEKADVVLYFFGLDEGSESEGLDRTHMKIPENQIRLLEKLHHVNENIVAVLSGGSVIEMPWEKECRAILHGYLTGEAGAGAILDILIGKVTPSGKLSETYPCTYEDTPAFYYYPSPERNSEYREALYVGYRYYQTVGTKVRYPFGYGLSYTDFRYSDLSVSSDKVSFCVTNIGNYDGAEIAQLYVRLPGAKVFRPDLELKGFRKVFLKTGESAIVTIPLDEKVFRYWNVKTDRWEVEGGRWELLIGASCEDIRLTGYLEQENTTDLLPYSKEELPHYFCGLVKKIGQKEYETLLGYPLPSGKWEGELDVNDAICQISYAKSPLARLIFKILDKKKRKGEQAGQPDLNVLFIYNMPFRAIAKMTEGMVSMKMVEGMVQVVNRHFFKGIGQIISGYFQNKKENREYERKLQLRR